MRCPLHPGTPGPRANRAAPPHRLAVRPSAQDRAGPTPVVRANHVFVEVDALIVTGEEMTQLVSSVNRCRAGTVDVASTINLTSSDEVARPAVDVQAQWRTAAERAQRAQVERYRVLGQRVLHRESLRGLQHVVGQDHPRMLCRARRVPCTPARALPRASVSTSRNEIRRAALALELGDPHREIDRSHPRGPGRRRRRHHRPRAGRGRGRRGAARHRSPGPAVPGAFPRQVHAQPGVVAQLADLDRPPTRP